MRELGPGVWHWQSSHPDWDEEQWWPELVSSYGIELGDDFLLFDPLSVPDELRERATPAGLASRCTRRPQTPGKTGSRSSASTPTACAAWRVRTSPGCARAKAKDTSTVRERG